MWRNSYYDSIFYKSMLITSLCLLRVYVLSFNRVFYKVFIDFVLLLVCFFALPFRKEYKDRCNDIITRFVKKTQPPPQ